MLACVHMCSVAQFTTDDIGLLWLTNSNQTTVALTYLRTLASNATYGILGRHLLFCCTVQSSSVCLQLSIAAK